MPRPGRMMMNRIHSVFAPPPRSRLRNRSPKIQNRHMMYAKKMKNSNIASKNEPLSSNMGPLLDRQAVHGAAPRQSHRSLAAVSSSETGGALTSPGHLRPA